MEEKRFRSGLRRLTRRGAMLALTGLVSVAFASPATAEEQQVWRAGNYSFSDELGGFAIRAVHGIGTREDPIVIEEELYSSSPVTLVIRAAGDIVPESDAGNLATSALHLRLAIRNESGQAWIEFEFELQEILHHASIFSDGLSFDQRRDNTDLIKSTRFAEYRRDFEPYDQMRFINGKVDPRDEVEFGFALTDFTPRWTFYLVQNPRIPSS